MDVRKRTERSVSGGPRQQEKRRGRGRKDRARPHLDEEVEEADVVVRRGRGVRALDELALDRSRDGDVLSDGEAKDLPLWQREPVAARIEDCVSARRLKKRSPCGGRTNMAVLGETAILSISLKRFHWVGSSAGLRSASHGVLVSSTRREREGNGRIRALGWSWRKARAARTTPTAAARMTWCCWSRSFQTGIKAIVAGQAGERESENGVKGRASSPTKGRTPALHSTPPAGLIAGWNRPQNTAHSIHAPARTAGDGCVLVRPRLPPTSSSHADPVGVQAVHLRQALHVLLLRRPHPATRARARPLDPPSRPPTLVHSLVSAQHRSERRSRPVR